MEATSIPCHTLDKLYTGGIHTVTSDPMVRSPTERCYNIGRRNCLTADSTSWRLASSLLTISSLTRLQPSTQRIIRYGESTYQKTRGAQDNAAKNVIGDHGKHEEPGVMELGA